MGQLDTQATRPFEGSLDKSELLAYKLFVDARIEPGKTYLLRPTNHKKYLFHGKPLKLVRVRAAEYCYQMRFDVPLEERTDPLDEKSRCVYTDNWYPEGIALTLVERRAKAHR